VKLVYGTTNKAKIHYMKSRVESLGIEILSLNDVGAPKLDIEESGNSPLENSRIKAQAYYDAMRRPVFSCDSGLYIDGLDDARQPGVHARGLNDEMNDEQSIAYYSALAAEFGGGGHMRAAGFSSDLTLEEVREMLKKRLTEVLSAK